MVKKNKFSRRELLSKSPNNLADKQTIHKQSKNEEKYLIKIN